MNSIRPHRADRGDQQCDGDGVLVVIHRNEISVLRMFCTRKMISSTARRAAVTRTDHAAPVQVCGTFAAGADTTVNSGACTGTGTGSGVD